jgi:hypothetical protein
MKNKALIRTLVFVAIFAWPAVECYRYAQAKQALAASERQQAIMSQQLAQVRAKHSEIARTAQVSPRR